MSNKDSAKDTGKKTPPIMSVSCPQDEWDEFKAAMDRFVADYANLFGKSRQGLKSMAIREVIRDSSVYATEDGRRVFGIVIPD